MKDVIDSELLAPIAVKNSRPLSYTNRRIPHDRPLHHMSFIHWLFQSHDRLVEALSIFAQNPQLLAKGNAERRKQKMTNELTLQLLLEK
jgi:hypothetical protein